MADRPETREALRSELLAWIRQNEELGPDWFLDEGSPEPLPAVEAPAADAPVAKAPAAAPAPPASVADPDDPFAATCSAFVAETLELIRRHGAAARPEAGETLEPIGAEVAACTACELHGGRTNTVFGSGSANASLVFIGEAPGADEDRQGQPFVGKSGQLLTKIIEAIDFARDEVYICNILKCRPPNNRDPLPAEVQACEGYLQRQLAVLRPRVICCLGRVAAQTLLQTDASLSRLRQTVHFYQDIPVMATYHPAALLRNPDWKRDTWEDVRKLRALHDALGT